MLRAWGKVAIRFSTLTVMRVSCAGFLLSVAGWPMVGLGESAPLLLLGLVAIHIVAGLTTAGVNLASGTIAMESRLEGQPPATSRPMRSSREPRRLWHRCWPDSRRTGWRRNDCP